MHATDKPSPGPGHQGGILLLDKPIEMSSMRAVSIVRKRLGLKVGHAGTLDPLATGVLLLGAGKATRSLELFMKTTKQYHTEIDLSAFTSTDDREGERRPVDIDTPPSSERIDELLATMFTGSFMQRPPDFSAKKIDGRRAYRIARAGGTPELTSHEVVVHRIDRLAYQWPLLTLVINCAHGFYVRSLARDLGLQLGTGGHCTSIRRTAVGPFTIDEAIDLDHIPDPMPPGSLLPLPEALQRLEAAG